MASNTLASPHLPKLHSLPDLVIDKILQFLPTKPAFQASFPSQRGQWQDVVSSLPALNFNEDDDFNRRNLKGYRLCKQQHKRFINFLKGYLDYRIQYDQKDQLLYKLTLDLRMYGRRDSSIVTNWLKYACHRDLEELDISPKMSIDSRLYRIGRECPVKVRHMYRLPWKVIVGATCLTSLKLEFVRVPFLHIDGVHKHLFPSLKTLAFKTAYFFTDQVLHNVLYECPSLEYLSLTECWIESSECYINCSSLKSLDVKHCWFNIIRVDEAFNLESFTFVSLPLSFPEYSRCEKMVLNSTFNLKYLNIRVDDYMGEFSLLGCHPALEAIIETQSVHRFVFFDGCLDASVSVIASDFYEATISVGTLLDQEWFLSYSTHFVRLMSFLTKFQNCRKINLYCQDVQALIVPKHHRVWNSPPLPRTSTLQVRMPNPPRVGSRDYFELLKSLRWIAPIAYIVIKIVDVEVDRKIVEQRASPAGLYE